MLSCIKQALDEVFDKQPQDVRLEVKEKIVEKAKLRKENDELPIGERTAEHFQE